MSSLLLSHITAQSPIPFFTNHSVFNRTSIPQFSNMDSISHFAGTASLSLSTASTPSLHTLWCANTGATLHMTPHRHWLQDYTPHRVPVRLANNSVVYSAGIGSVLFVPEMEGRKIRSVQFTNVLHVPDLQ